MRRKTIIDAAEIAGQIEVMAMYENGEELECIATENKIDARRIFLDMITRYAEPMQQAFYRADMKPGNKYTIFHLGEFGFPIAQKIIFYGIECGTYAQHSDVITLVYKPFGKRGTYRKRFCNASVIICDGWQDIEETKTVNVVKDTAEVKATITKYSCFDARYIEDAEKYLQNILSIHKRFRTGVNGTTYA